MCRHGRLLLAGVASDGGFLGYVGPTFDSFGVVLARVSIGLAMACFTMALVFGALASFDVGLKDPAPVSDDVAQRLVDFFETTEAEYLLYGRWNDLAWALGFAGLLVAVPFLPSVSRAKHLLVSGAVLAIAGDMIDLSKLAGIQIARFGLDRGLEASFTGGNAFRTAINTTSTYVWVAGLFIFAMGLAVLASDSSDRRWSTSSYLYAGTLIAVGFTGLWAQTPYPEAATTTATIAVIVWGLAAVRHIKDEAATTPTGQDTT